MATQNLTKKITKAIIENTKTVASRLTLKGESTVTQVLSYHSKGDYNEDVIDIIETDQGGFILKSGDAAASLRNFIKKSLAEGAIRFEVSTMPSYEYSEAESARTKINVN